MTPKDPLDEIFGGDGEFLDEVVIEIPDDPELDHIIEFSLKEYKGIRDILDLIEPKSRIRYYEMMERFLANAKDAMYKKEMVKIHNEKLKVSKGKGKPVADNKTEEENSVSRSDLYKLKRVK